MRVKILFGLLLASFLVYAERSEIVSLAEEAAILDPVVKSMLARSYLAGDKRFLAQMEKDNYRRNLESYLKTRNLFPGWFGGKNGSPLNQAFLIMVAGYHYGKLMDAMRIEKELEDKILPNSTPKTLARYFFLKGVILHSAEFGLTNSALGPEENREADETLLRSLCKAVESGFPAEPITEYLQNYYSANTATFKTQERTAYKAEAFGRIGIAYEKAQEMDIAKSMYEKAIEYGTTNPDVYNNIAKMYGNRERIPLIRKGIQAMGKDEEAKLQMLHGILAQSFENLEMWEEARDAYQNAGNKTMAKWIEKNKL